MPKLPDMSPCGASKAAHLLHSVSPSNRLPKFAATWVGAPRGISDLAQRVRNVFEIIDWQRSDLRVWRHLVGFSTLYNVLPKSIFFAMILRNGGVPATCVFALAIALKLRSSPKERGRKSPLIRDASPINHPSPTITTTTPRRPQHQSKSVVVNTAGILHAAYTVQFARWRRRHVHPTVHRRVCAANNNEGDRQVVNGGPTMMLRWPAIIPLKHPNIITLLATDYYCR